ncbi:unnamed protein product [Closterium sp. Naga37s-1]|nr:unnamed protein product [Closterium sp. Naga37s-1]
MRTLETHNLKALCAALNPSSSLCVQLRFGVLMVVLGVLMLVVITGRSPRPCFGVLMLVVITGRSPRSADGDKKGHILRWVEDQISSGNLASLKDVSMDAPDDAVLRLAQLAMRCTVERTAGRPNMTGVANELQGIRQEVVGKEELSSAIKVDLLAQEMRTGTSFPNDLAEELRVIKSMDEETSNTGLQGIEYSSFGSGRM